jgi:hypothetical protein
MCKSVLALISLMAVSKPLWRRFAQTGKGASLIIFPVASRIDSSPKNKFIKDCMRPSLVPAPVRSLPLWEEAQRQFISQIGTESLRELRALLTSAESAVTKALTANQQKP